MKIQLSVQIDNNPVYRNIEIPEAIIGDNKAIQDLLGNQALDMLETLLESDKELEAERKETKGY